jgi:type I restriction enzyme S subunit
LNDSLVQGNCSPNNGDIIISKDGANCLDLIFVYDQPDKIVLLSSIAIARLKKGYDSYFLMYYLLSPTAQYLMRNNFVSGSAIPRVVLKDFRKVLVPSIPYEEQSAISSVLKSLDDKIDLLHRQNKTFEQLTETLFRQWFIEEANTEEEISLKDIVETVNGFSYKSSELNPSENALVTLKSFHRDGSFRLDGFKEFTGKINQRQTVKQGDLIVAHTDITQEADVIGNPVLVIEDPKYKTLIMTMDCVKVIPTDERFSISFLYYLMRRPEFKHHCLGCANGTTVLHLSKLAIPTFTFPKPDFEKVKLFTTEADALIQKTFINHNQIKTLTKLRDTLLPKLMSGEVRMEN